MTPRHENNMWKKKKRKDGNILFNDALNTFLFTVIWCWEEQNRKQKSEHIDLLIIGNFISYILVILTCRLKKSTILLEYELLVGKKYILNHPF